MTSTGQQPAAQADNGGTGCEHEWYRSGTTTFITTSIRAKRGMRGQVTFTPYWVYRCTMCNATRNEPITDYGQAG